MIDSYTVNRLDRWTSEVSALVFENLDRAIAYATEEVLRESTAWVTVTDERTGEDLFDEKGSFV